MNVCDAPVAENDWDPGAADTNDAAPPKLTTKNALTSITGNIRRAQKVGKETEFGIDTKSKKFKPQYVAIARDKRH